MLDNQTNQMLLQFEALLQTCNTEVQLKSIYEKFKEFKNPHVEFRTGETFLAIFKNKCEALPYLISGASYGLDPKNIYYSNHLSNSIGQCFWYLLNNYVYGFVLSYEYNICCLAYIYLSKCINLIGIQANDSLRSRALLINSRLKKYRVKEFLNEYYYKGNDLCTEILSISDYFYSALSFRNDGDINEYNRCLSWAKENMEKILSLKQYSPMKMLNLESISEISKQNHEYIFKKMEPDFLRSKFSYPSNSFKEDLIKGLIEIR